MWDGTANEVVLRLLSLTAKYKLTLIALEVYHIKKNSLYMCIRKSVASEYNLESLRIIKIMFHALM